MNPSLTSVRSGKSPAAALGAQPPGRQARCRGIASGRAAKRDPRESGLLPPAARRYRWQQNQAGGRTRTVITESDDPLTTRKLLTCAEEALRQKLTGPAAKSSLSLAESFTVPTVDLRVNDRCQLEAKLQGTPPRWGRRASMSPSSSTAERARSCRSPSRSRRPNR